MRFSRRYCPTVDKGSTTGDKRTDGTLLWSSWYRARVSKAVWNRNRRYASCDSHGCDRCGISRNRTSHCTRFVSSGERSWLLPDIPVVVSVSVNVVVEVGAGNVEVVKRVVAVVAVASSKLATSNDAHGEGS